MKAGGGKNDINPVGHLKKTEGRLDEDIPKDLNIILFNTQKWAESPQLLRASGTLFHMKQPSAGAREQVKDEGIGGLFTEAGKPNNRMSWFTEDVLGKEPTREALKEQKLGGEEEKKTGVIQPTETRPKGRWIAHSKGSE